MDPTDYDLDVLWNRIYGLDHTTLTKQELRIRFKSAFEVKFERIPLLLNNTGQQDPWRTIFLYRLEIGQ